ncbi:MAG: ABC transporter substrate-binding protein [Spartobacteria bacterium]
MSRFSIALLSAMMLFFAGCKKTSTPEPASVPEPTPAPTPTPLPVINVGVFLPLKGLGQGSANEVLNGLAMGAEEVNAGGGVIGHMLRLVVRDTRAEPERAEKAVKDLVKEDKAVALIGGLSAGSAEAAMTADEMQIPLLALGSTMPGIPSQEPFIFRICQTDFHSGRVMAKFAATLGAKRALVLYDPADEFSKTLALAFGKQFKRKPDARIAGEAFATGTVDFTKHLQTIKKKNPDVVYLPLPADQAAPILRKARELGLTMPFLGTANWDSLEFPLMVGESGNNTYFPGRFNPDGPSDAVQLFLEVYERKNGNFPSASAAMGYDALVVLADAIRRANTTDPAKLREALASTMNFPGLTGEITTDPELARVEALPLLKLDTGKISFLEMIETN